MQEAKYPVERKDSKEDEQAIPWYAIVGKCAMGALTYPIEYVRVLIQLGYEPIDPVPCRQLFGRPALKLPGALSYMGYIRGVDGFFGLYRGFSANLCGNFVYNTIYIYTTYQLPVVPTFDEDQAVSSEEDKVLHFIQRTTNEMAARAMATIASQPFHVISMRMMAQFIGGEMKYNSIIGSIKEIIHDEGFFGLFSGLLPRLTGEIVRISLVSTVVFCINNYIVEDPRIRSYISGTTGFFAASLTYPFHCVSTVMSVTGAPIEAGGPPHMARYQNWTQCWNHLSQIGQLKRGSSLIWRYYPGPIQISPDGTARKIPIDMSLLRKVN